ncbi:hypothetical protein GCM10010990_04790 [Croceicoccus mobilis]|uniref:Anti-sigma factor NepR domain-containing protein n=1 Tax=Croceicoccus mobilis TaxID=1703339 RepID=A0A916YRT4_9SPHN|nr:hypothetical protein GCM10010990_04790 [Croceicoccus mobilis]
MTGKGNVKKDQSDEPKNGDRRPVGKDGPGQRPEWAVGLRQLYDSVVEEPLPDSFGDLLKKLDGEDS